MTPSSLTFTKVFLPSRSRAPSIESSPYISFRSNLESIISAILLLRMM